MNGALGQTQLDANLADAFSFLYLKTDKGLPLIDTGKLAEGSKVKQTHFLDALVQLVHIRIGQQYIFFRWWQVLPI